MPTADAIFAKLKTDVFFSKFDLCKGFWQIPLREEDKPKTAFVTPDGIYQFKKMPFGLVNATATFNRMMRKALCHIPNALSFVDDILIHTESWEEHLATLKSTLDVMRSVNLTIKPSKCRIGCRKLDFVGHKIGDGTIEPQPDKIDKILTAPAQKTKKEVRAFLGLAGYYRTFVPNFSIVTAPLSDLTRKGPPRVVKWGAKVQEAFDKLKSLVSQEPILKMPDFARTFYLQTDASADGAGAVLLQEYEDHKHQIAFFSKKFSDRERAYSTVERKCLALIWGIQKFHLYLYGIEFVIETDHKPLTFIGEAKITNSRVMRWSLFLKNYHVNALKGSSNVIADYMSRICG